MVNVEELIKDTTIENLEQEVANLPQPIEEVAEAPEEVLEEDPTSALYKAIEDLGGPTRTQIEQMKSHFGDVYILPIDEENLFLYRPLKRGEWIQLQGLFNSAGNNFTEDKKEEVIVEKCLIWPKINAGEMIVTKAGFVKSLNEAIMLSSYFLPTSLIAAIAEKL